MLPAHVVGIIATSDDPGQGDAGYTSHAVILARGRDIPVACVHRDVVTGINEDDVLVLDTTASAAVLWIAPDERVVADTKLKRDAWMLARAQEDANVVDSLRAGGR